MRLVSLATLVGAAVVAGPSAVVGVPTSMVSSSEAPLAADLGADASGGDALADEDDEENDLLFSLFSHGEHDAHHVSAVIAALGSEAANDLLYLDNVDGVKTPALIDPQLAADKVRKFKEKGEVALKRAEAVGAALQRALKQSVNSADERLTSFKKTVASLDVDDSTAAYYNKLAEEAERVSGSIVRLGKAMSVRGFGKTDPTKIWNVFKYVADEVQRQVRNQIVNAGTYYKSKYGEPTKRYPVALVPGFGGNRLEARRLTKEGGNPCGIDYTKFTDVWFSSTKLFHWLTNAETQSCVASLMALQWDGTRFASNREYEVKPVWGTRGMDLLDHGVASSLSEYYNPLITSLETVGYRRDVSILGLSYDWRLAPTDEKATEFFEQWRQEIEKAYDVHSLPVVAVAHSMGNNHWLYFLSQHIGQNAKYGNAWLRKYIKSYVAIGAPSTGVPKVLKSLISGTSFSLPMMNKKMTSTMVQSFGSAAWMLPTAQGWGNKPLMTIMDKRADQKRKYSAANMEELLQATFLKSTEQYHQSLSKLYGVPPQFLADSHVYYGQGVRTPVSFVFDRVYTEAGELTGLEHVRTKKTSGDGTVPESSAAFLCSHWKGVHCQGYDNVRHRELLWHTPLLAEILEIGTGLRNATGLDVGAMANPKAAPAAEASQAVKEDAIDIVARPTVDGTFPVDSVPGAEVTVEEGEINSSLQQ